MTEKEIECVELRGVNNSREWRLNEKTDATKDLLTVGYLFTHPASNQRIHLVLFYFRSGSLWTGKINNTEDVANELGNFKFGLYEELFDDFELTKSTRIVRMLADPMAFLMEKNNSRYRV